MGKKIKFDNSKLGNGLQDAIKILRDQSFSERLESLKSFTIKDLCISASIASVLSDMRDNDPDKYRAILRNCELFETIGIVYINKLVRLEDIMARFEVGILRVYVAFGWHIRNLQHDDEYALTSRQLYNSLMSLGEAARLYIISRLDNDIISAQIDKETSVRNEMENTYNIGFSSSKENVLAEACYRQELKSRQNL